MLHPASRQPFQVLGFFGQDSWKASPSLTINYGLRWDIARPWSDVYGRLTTPVPGVQSVKFPNSPLGNLVPGDPGVPARSPQPDTPILVLVLVSPMRPPAACGVRPARPVFVRPTVSTTWASRITVTSVYWGCSVGPLLGIAATNRVRKPLHHPRKRNYPGTALPLYLPLWPGAVSQLPVRKPDAPLRARLLQPQQDHGGPAL